MICKKCSSYAWFLMENGLCRPCFELRNVKVESIKKAIGRPRTKTDEERAEARKQWFRDNPRKEYNSAWRRKKCGTIRGIFGVTLLNRWLVPANERRSGKWGPKSRAYIFTSRKRAEASALMHGGDVVDLAPKKEERIEVYKPKFVIMINGGWRSTIKGKITNDFDKAKIYQSKAQAEKALHKLTCGIILERLETSIKTLRNGGL